MSSVIEFIEARIADDEAAAQEAADGFGEEPQWWVCPEFQHVAMSPDRAVADCNMKRGLLEQIKHLQNRGPMKQDLEWATRRMLSYLAHPYREHPEYLSEWNFW